MKILLIDDDSDDRALFQEALEEVAPDLICETEADGRTAVFNVQKLSDQLPDLIFVDINMPKISGWECLDNLKADLKTKDIPVIMYSTSSSERDVDRASRSGAVGLITKHSEYGELKDCLSRLVNAMRMKSPLVPGYIDS